MPTANPTTPSRSSRRLAMIFAHPDDESFGPSGTILRYAAAGVDVHYICATLGEAGEVDPEYLEGYRSIAELRRAELDCAAERLGLAGLHLLGYRDSGMEGSADNDHPDSLARAPLDKVVQAIADHLARIEPQVVITFDASGGYFHPDHVKVHRAATAAFRQASAASHVAKLYYTVFPRRLVRFMVMALPLLGRDPSALGRNNDIDLRRVAQVRQTVTTRIAVDRYYDGRQAAARCHASQNARSRIGLPDMIRRFLVRHDEYSREEPPWTGGPLETDLFAGL